MKITLFDESMEEHHSQTSSGVDVYRSYLQTLLELKPIAVWKQDFPTLTIAAYPDDSIRVQGDILTWTLKGQIWSSVDVILQNVCGPDFIPSIQEILLIVQGELLRRQIEKKNIC